MQNQFIALSPGYKFKTGAIKIKHVSSSKSFASLQTKNAKRMREYRAYDKEKLLDEIQNVMNKRNIALAQNQALKNKISLSSTLVHFKRIPEGQLSTITISIKQENQALENELKAKIIDLETFKKQRSYTDFLEVASEYDNNKEELKRLKSLLKQKDEIIAFLKKQKGATREMHLKSIVRQERELSEGLWRNTQIGGIINDLENEIRHLRDKNTQMIKNNRRLEEDIEELQSRFPETNKPAGKRLAKTSQNSRQTLSKKCKTNDLFNVAVKTKKQTTQSIGEQESQYQRDLQDFTKL